jgi:hypothetical protein
MTVLGILALVSSQGKEMAAEKNNPQRSASWMDATRKRRSHLVHLGSRLACPSVHLFVLFRIAATGHNVAVSFT